MKTLINIKADKNIKKDAQRIAADLGFSLSAVVNAYLRQFVRNKEIYFGLSPEMSPALEKLLGKVEKDIKRNKNISPALTSKREIKEYLSSL